VALYGFLQVMYSLRVVSCSSPYAAWACSRDGSGQHRTNVSSAIGDLSYIVCSVLDWHQVDKLDSCT